MRIKKILVNNFKAVENQELNLDGCSAIITAGNNKGKSSILNGLISRIRGEIPEVIVKQGEENGFNKLEFTDNSSLEWKFTQKSESFVFTTKEGLKVKSGVIKEIGKRFFGQKFDIDKFISSSKKEQVKQLSELLGLNLDELNNRYNIAYTNRTDVKKTLLNLKAKFVSKPDEVAKPEINSILEKIKEAKESNHAMRANWAGEMVRTSKEIAKFNEEQSLRELAIHNASLEVDKIKSSLDAIGMTDEKERGSVLQVVLRFIGNLTKPEPKKEEVEIKEPEYIDIETLEKDLQTANDQLRAYDQYATDLRLYEAHLLEVVEAEKAVEVAEKEVAEILDEKKEMLEKASIPDEFEFVEGGVCYKGYPLSHAQLSSSAKYIAALKLGSLALGELRTLHFDASFLDKNSLKEIQKWASEEGLQLLIERPDFEGGEIQYQITEEL